MLDMSEYKINGLDQDLEIFLTSPTSESTYFRSILHMQGIRDGKKILPGKKSCYLKIVGTAYTLYLINSSFFPDLFPRKGSEIHKWLSLNWSKEKSYITN